MRSTLRRLTQLAVVVLSTAVVAPLSSSLQAQINAPQADSVVEVSAPAVHGGAPVTGLRSGVHTRETARALQPVAAATHASLGQSRALMIVGAAALITGAIIGGDPGTIIMVGGAVIGLYGLYQYLQ